MQLRPARPEDAPRLRELVRRAYGKYVERMGREPRPMTQDYGEVIADLDVAVAEREGQIVGMVALEYDEEEQGFMLDNVAVDPAHHGKGVGRALLEHAEREARRHGHEEILLYTHSTMSENLALYARIGYAEYERRPIDPGEIVMMRKRLEACPGHSHVPR
jgi:N-acetylglutamate synthase-like GNAT family acetyltransferase